MTMGYGVNGELYGTDRESEELAHFGVKGMKWGVRKRRSTLSRLGMRMANSKFGQAGRKVGQGVQSVRKNGVSGAIRIHQTKAVKRDMAETAAKKRSLMSERREIEGYGKNATGFAAGKFATAIRNRQIKSVDKMVGKLDKRQAGNKQVLKELKDIESYQNAKRNKKR